MNSTTTESWEKFLHPESLKTNLIAISLFITAFENFKTRIIEKPEMFFSDGVGEHGWIINKNEYQKEVILLSDKKSKLYGSLFWFQKIGAISALDIEKFDEIRKHRNELAHEPMEFLTNSEKNLDISKFKDLIDLLSKIEKWWIINFELEISPEMLPDGANPEDIIPGPIWSLQLMLDIALGNEPKEGFYYEAFKSQKT